MEKEQATQIFLIEFNCSPEGFRGINEPYYFIRKDVADAMEALGFCSMCLGSGTSWAECCNGSGGCYCNGTAVSFKCQICRGSGRLDGFEDKSANLKYIHDRAVANKGYFFPK